MKKLLILFAVTASVLFYNCGLNNDNRSNDRITAAGNGTTPAGNNLTFIYVSASGNDENPGTQSDPKLTIQNAVDSASTSCEIRVSAGTYNISSQLTMKNGVSIMGSYSPDFTSRDIALYQTIIADTRDPALFLYKKIYTIYCSGISSSVKIDGFTINGGNSADIDTTGSYCIYNTSSTLTISNNIINGGTANLSCGIDNESSNTVISENIISGGCGIRNAYSNPVIKNNKIYGSGINQNLTFGNITYGICNYISSPSIINNLIRAGKDKAGYYSFGIFNDTSCSPAIVNNTIDGGGNSSCYGVRSFNGSHPVITNNIIFVTNIKYGYGISEAYTNSNTESLKNNCIFNCPTALYEDDGSVNVTSIDTSVSTNEGTETLVYWGNINEGSTAMFVDFAGGDWRLNNSAPLNIRGGGVVVSGITADINGNARTPGLPIGMTNTGASGWSMGAYEKD